METIQSRTEAHAFADGLNTSLSLPLAPAVGGQGSRLIVSSRHRGLPEPEPEPNPLRSALSVLRAAPRPRLAPGLLTPVPLRGHPPPLLPAAALPPRPARSPSPPKPKIRPATARLAGPSLFLHHTHGTTDSHHHHTPFYHAAVAGTMSQFRFEPDDGRLARGESEFGRFGGPGAGSARAGARADGPSSYKRRKVGKAAVGEGVGVTGWVGMDEIDELDPSSEEEEDQLEPSKQ